MANPLFQELNQRPKVNVNMQDALRELKSNPAQLIQRAGYKVPANIANNPQAAVMHILQSGQVRSPVMSMLNRFMGKR